MPNEKETTLFALGDDKRKHVFWKTLLQSTKGSKMCAGASIGINEKWKAFVQDECAKKTLRYWWEEQVCRRSAGIYIKYLRKQIMLKVLFMSHKKSIILFA